MKMEGVKIMLLDRGRVKVGRLSRHPELAFHWLLEGARVIRRWGTTQGLEQLANHGPTKDTVLDQPCTVTIPFRAVIEILETEESKWTAALDSNGASPARRKSTTPTP